jgi:protein gp37
MIGRGLPKMGHEGPFSRLQFHPDRLDVPLRWKKPRRIFVGSMTDLFHPDVEKTWLRKVFRTMGHAHRHTFMILTKRPALMRELIQDLWNWSWPGAAGLVPRDVHGDDLPLPNVWLGVTAENQEMLNLRWPFLRDTPAARYFISYEPGLGPLILPPVFLALGNRAWIIAGGESGPGARPMNPDWARSLRDQCQAAGVPFFFKQNGEWASVSDVEGKGAHFQFPDGATVRRVGKKAAGCLLDGRRWKESP